MIMRILAALLLFTVTASAQCVNADPDGILAAVPVGLWHVVFPDPDDPAQHGLIVMNAGNAAAGSPTNVVIAQLDPVTGFVVGALQTIADNFAGANNQNGPEWARDAGGRLCILYRGATAGVADGVHAVCRPSGGGSDWSAFVQNYDGSLVIASSPKVIAGTMGNNGALSGITAVATAYPNAYCYMPAAAIASGSAAGWYYAVFSSTTAATLYNNTYTSGTPAIPGSPTAFSTTGPGAYTQTTATYIAGYTLPIAGGTIGANGSVKILALSTNNSSGNNKTFLVQFGGTMNVSILTQTSSQQAGVPAGFSNRGSASAQVWLPYGLIGTTGATTYGTVNTASSQNLQFFFNMTTTTDTMIYENIEVELLPGVSWLLERDLDPASNDNTPAFATMAA